MPAPPDLADRLVTEFGSISGLLAAPDERLARIAGVGVALRIRLLRDIVRHATLARLSDAPILGSTSAVLAHVRAELAHLRSEQVLAVFLDARHRLLRSEILFRGSLGAAPLQSREIVARALELNAAGLIVAHNHPSGDPAPSPADVRSTQSLCHALKAVGVQLLDHIIVGSDGSSSLRVLGLM